MNYYPEGKLIGTVSNRSYLRSPQSFRGAIQQNKTLETHHLTTWIIYNKKNAIL